MHHQQCLAPGSSRPCWRCPPMSVLRWRHCSCNRVDGSKHSTVQCAQHTSAALMQCEQCKRWSWGLPKQVLQGTGTWTSTIRVRPGLKHWHRQWWIAADFCDRLHSNQVLYNKQWILRFLKNNIYFNIWMTLQAFSNDFFCSFAAPDKISTDRTLCGHWPAVKNLFTIRCSIITNRHSGLTTGASFVNHYLERYFHGHPA